MKIGIDARFYGIAGPGRYVSNLISELEKIDTKNQYVIFLTKKGSDEYKPRNPNFKKWIADIPWYSIEEQTLLLADFMRADLDLLHVPHFNVPILYRGKTVITIHDLTMHEFNTTSSTTLPGPLYAMKNAGYKVVINSAAKHAKKIITPSATVRDEVINKLKVNPEKIIVSYEGVDDSLLSQSPKDERVLLTRIEEMGIKSRYFLYVGSAYPHKNLNTLIVSYKEFLDRSGLQNQLILAGKIDEFSQRTAAFSHALKLDGKVIYAAKFSEGAKYVSDKDLAYLYRGALAYVFPSLKEGFSITPLEAQAFGVPVVLSDIPTHREIFQDSVLYFDPNSNIDITEKLNTIIKDENLRHDLIRKGFENIKKYSWNKMAQDTLKIYESA
jgi:glycosyltransferase involved in cell wall biosynthesis